MTVSQRWFFLVLFLVVSLFLYMLQPILMPFLLGALIAYVGDPIVDKLEEHQCPRAVGVSIVFSVFTLLSILALLLIVPSLLKQLEALRALVPNAVMWAEKVAAPWLADNLGWELERLSSSNIRQAVQNKLSGHGSLLASVAAQVTTSSLSMLVWVANLLLVPVVSFYLMRDWDTIIERIHNLLPRNLEQNITYLAKESDEVLGAFLKGQLMVMLALGVIYSLGLWIVGLDLALLIGMVAGLSSIVPYLGFIVGIGAALIAAVFQFQEWLPLLYVCIVFGVGQTLESVLLTPILVGDKIGLHPVAVIFAIMAGGQLFGFVGVLLALPVAAVVMVILRFAYHGYKGSHFYHAEK
ncbi:AI-2E family transporter [Litoribacillus peritrichatus]|uniref:AI-2E family transporter n=1 Tax=Litoribacillus peritrichatus TaxID=718191 RepID=A0ABP7M607_9GAMM